MALITESNREEFIKSMARHFAHTMSEEELRHNIDKDPSILEDYAEFKMNENDYE